MACDRLNLLLVAADDEKTRLFMQAICPYESFPCVHVKTAMHALAVLRGSNGHTPLRYPYIIFLDLDMPDSEALHFLQALRLNPSLESSLVYGLAHTCEGEAVQAAFEMGVAGCIPKAQIDEDFDLVLAMLASCADGFAPARG